MSRPAYTEAPPTVPVCGAHCDAAMRAGGISTEEWFPRRRRSEEGRLGREALSVEGGRQRREEGERSSTPCAVQRLSHSPTRRARHLSGVALRLFHHFGLPSRTTPLSHQAVLQLSDHHHHIIRD